MRTRVLRGPGRPICSLGGAGGYPRAVSAIVGSATEPTAPAPGGTPDPGLRPGLAACPFLRSEDASWSSRHASRELRCWALRPPAQLALQKQARLCVTDAYVSCATYVAAVAADPVLAQRADDDPGLWPDTSSAPVVLEPPRGRGGGPGWLRPGGQALLVGLMALAFLALAIGHTVSPDGSSASQMPVPSPSTPASGALGASATPSPSATASSSPAASHSTVPSAAVSPSPAAPSPGATAGPTPGPIASSRTYTVQSGDTLSAIAAKFGTSVQAIATANKIADPRTIHPGQVLVIP